MKNRRTSLMARCFTTTILAGLVGAALAFAASFALTPQWEVVATLKVGAVSGHPIESTAEFVDRLRSPLTLQAVAVASGDENLERHLQRLRDATRVSVIGSSVQLRIRAQNQEKAMKLANVYLSVVSRQQERLLADQVDALKALGLVAKHEVIATKDGAVLKMARNDGGCDLIHTYPTRFSVEPAGFHEPVSPVRSLMSLAGLLVGLASGIGATFLRPRSSSVSR